MIEKIFIPTVNRVDNQITYNSLPEELKKRVVFVIQSWEKEKYNYECEYLVLPEEVNLSDYYCISKTRKIIYEAGQNIKYAVLDDDITFGRRNAKYWTNISNMETSKRKATPDDILEMFELFDKWLDDEDVTVCGCGFVENPPQNKPFSVNSSIGSVFWINGNHFKDILPTLDLTSVKVGEDVVFLLSLLTRGYGNRVSQEFVFFNESAHKKSMKSYVWDEQTYENTQKDHERIEKMFPGIFTILYDEETGDRVSGGYRNFGKSKILWSKAYKRKIDSPLLQFL